uniref:Uncharacterized protein n=1 Tax=Kryptolebias marmoratus TaxID=37003 RepID=A0A3Q3F7U6_KRYMA
MLNLKTEVLFGPTRKFSSHLFPGRYHLIGSSEPIVAAPGDDVILPCRVDPDMDAVEKTVEWSKPDLEVDPSDRQKYVFLYRSQRENRHMMMAAYIERTSLSSEGLKHGDVSLRIRNVTSLQDRLSCSLLSAQRFKPTTWTP